MKQRLTILLALALCMANAVRALEPDESGIYHIGTAKDLADFAALVGSGEQGANAILTADIDYTEDYVQIGGDYKGTFDGDGHTVSIAIVSTKQGAALFFNNRGTVKNLRVTGTIQSSSNNPGGICYYNYGTIRNCVAEVDFILSRNASVTAGGISGQATSGSLIENCMFNGSFIRGEGATQNTTHVAGISGWQDGAPTVRNCLVIASSDLGGDFKPVGRGYNRATNTYYMQKAGSVTTIQSSTGATEVNEQKLASGEVAYLTGATQNIDTETVPNFLGTSGKVYAIGAEGNRCDLAPLGGIASYSNTEPTVSAHNYVDGICTICNSYDASQIVDGVYMVSTARQLASLAQKVNAGDNRINIKLTADIDFTKDYVQIGGNYYGTFDGAGHTVEVNMTGTANQGVNAALFYNMRGTVQNLRVTGTVTSAYSNPSSICYYNYGTIRNCVAEVDFILSRNASVTAGGISGQATSGSLIENCMFNGTFTRGEGATENTNNVAGITGWQDASPQVRNCFVMASSNLGGDFKAVARGTNRSTNTYYIEKAGGTTAIQESAGAKLVTEEQVASGEVAYLTGATQDLDTESVPNFLGTSSTVYAIGAGGNRCDLAPIGNIVSYSNTEPAVSAHDYVGGVCSVCGSLQEDYVQQVNGFYQIENGEGLAWFATLVQRGNPTANARLMNDIELTDEWITPIGTDALAYQGTFDGGGHKISDFNLTFEGGRVGLFGNVINAIIRNFSIEGIIIAIGNGVSSDGVGTIGWAERTIVENIHSSLTIDATSGSGLGSTHAGGVVGSLRTGSSISRCSFSGVVTTGTNKVGCLGGVIGYINDDVKVSSCANYGTLASSASDGCVGGVIGYMNSGQARITNCLGAGGITCDAATGGGAIVGVQNDWGFNNGRDAVTNCYWLEGSALFATGRNDNGKNPSVTEDELSSGEVAWNLNDKSFINPIWHQNIGIDNYPLLYGDAIVYQTVESFKSFNPTDPSSFAVFLDDVVENELATIAETIACQELLDDYREEVTSWKSIDTMNRFIVAYTAAQQQRNAIKASVAAYAGYVQACNNAANYIEENNLEGNMTDFLKAYLEEYQAPSANYPNGTYSYVLEKHLLDNEEVAQETSFVNQMLQNAIAGGITSGTEITRLLTNPDFENGLEGWTTENTGGGIATGGVKELMPIARGLGCDSFCVSQSLAELPAGIYMATVNGMFRSGTDVTTKFYAGQFCLNGTANYIMSPGEDVIDESEAVDRVNCYISEDARYELDVYGYVPNTMVGASYAFSAERYLNLCATEVTDGNLQVALRSLGTGLANDFMPFGGLHVYYLGTKEEAADKLADVLQGFVGRAQTIVDFEYSEDEDYQQRPNISAELSSQLSDAISEAEVAETGEEMMKLIQTFSNLFAEVHAQRKAYIEMKKAANELFNLIDVLISAEVISEEEARRLEDMVYDAMDHYVAGDVTAEEALAIAADLMDALPLKAQDGLYELASANDVKIFSLLVGQGYGAAGAVLTADIDMSEVSDFMPIGSKEAGRPFTGTFDGQGHSITDFTLESAMTEGQGLFGFVKGATVKNFTISGSIDIYGGTGVGVVGWAQDYSAIQNVHSSLVINVYEASSHVGGVVGSLRTGSKVTGCSFSGSITDEASSHDCFGGVVGYANEYCSIVNCANYAPITTSGAECYVGGILGYLNNASFAGVKNCLNVGAVRVPESTTTSYSGAIGGWIRANDASSFQNNYWLEGSAAKVSSENAVQGDAVSAERLKSGEICYKLNGDQTEIVWRQTIATDDYPLLLADHLQVWLYDGAYINVDPVGIASPSALTDGDASVYDLSGRKLTRGKAQKGVYIIGGKKVLVK